LPPSTSSLPTVAFQVERAGTKIYYSLAVPQLMKVSRHPRRFGPHLVPTNFFSVLAAPQE
jgi:hypothetical protein